MKRAVKVSLKFATVRKQGQVFALLQSYRFAVNFYIKSLWLAGGKLDSPTLARLQKTRLSERYKSQALKQALELVIATKKSAKALRKSCSRPVFNGSAILDSKFVVVEEGKGVFDLIVRLSTLKRGNRITLPTKHTKMTRKWLLKPNAKFIQGCSLSENGIVLWVEVPELPMKTTGKVLGVDLGVNKLISDSDGNHYGKNFKAIRDKIRRSKPKSNSRYRHFKERDNFIGRVVNQLPWQELSVVGVEELKGIKTGKKKGRNKDFRKAMAPWIVRQVVGRIENKTSENRVCLIKVDPAKTSQTCPICRGVSKENRKGEDFQCVSCGYTGDADSVGALNILAKTLETLGSLESPRQLKAIA